jgi:hypothetical protein
VGRAGEKRQFCEGDRGKKPPCGQRAGWGTDHPGIGFCKNHGGSTPNHQLAAVPEMAFASRVDVPDMSPRETLLWLIKETTDEAAYYTLMIRLLSDEQVWGYHEAFVDRPRKLQKGAESKDERVQETRTSEPRLHIWINARASAFDRLARYIKMAEDIGIAEREIQLAERHGAQIADMLGAVLEGLGLSPAQRKKAPAVIEGAMRQLEAGAAPLAA